MSEVNFFDRKCVKRAAIFNACEQTSEGQTSSPPRYAARNVNTLYIDFLPKTHKTTANSLKLQHQRPTRTLSFSRRKRRINKNDENEVIGGDRAWLETH